MINIHPDVSNIRVTSLKIDGFRAIEKNRGDMFIYLVSRSVKFCFRSITLAENRARQSARKPIFLPCTVHVARTSTSTADSVTQFSAL